MSYTCGRYRTANSKRFNRRHIFYFVTMVSLNACKLEKEFQRQLSIELDNLEKNSYIFSRDLSLRRSFSIEAEGKEIIIGVSN